jgi:hypothetical protein
MFQVGETLPLCMCRLTLHCYGMFSFFSPFYFIQQSISVTVTGQAKKATLALRPSLIYCASVSEF